MLNFLNGFRKKYYFVIYFFDKNYKLAGQVLYSCKKCKEKEIVNFALKKIREKEKYVFFDIENLEN